MNTWLKKNISIKQLLAAGVVCLFPPICYAIAAQVIGWLDLSFHSVMLPIDANIPLISFFIIPYVACFAYWFFGYYLLVRERTYIKRIAITAALGGIICFVIFVLYPTHIDRPAIPDGGLIYLLLKIVYAFDAPACNLFPSMHVFCSWLFFIYARARRPARPWLIVFTLGFALLTCASVLFTRQHFIVDIPAGILLAEICWALSRWERLQRLTDWFWNWVYKDKPVS